MELDPGKPHGVIADEPVAVEKRLTLQMKNLFPVKLKALEGALKFIKSHGYPVIRGAKETVLLRVNL